MSFSDEYIEKQTKHYTQEALQDGVLVSPDECGENDGQHALSKRDLETPDSFVEDMMQTWTVDLGLTEARESEIRAIVVSVVSETIPEELLRHM